MSFNYANRMSHVKGSAARAMLKITRNPEVISFAGGLPAPELFPVEEFKQMSKLVLEENGANALQYGPAEGYEPLRKQIAERMKKSSVEIDPSNILITSGSQQGLDFSAKIFINPGDIIICESPSYLGAINAFNAYEPDYIDIKTDDDGMVMEDLEYALKNNDNVKLIYVIPDFQNPSGKTWSLDRRKQLVELANKYNVVIVEDNPYGELIFEGEMLPAIKHFDTEDRVIFLGTFSKIFSPGLRIGWAASGKEIIHQFNLCKQGADLQSSTISQMELSKFLDNYDIEEHINKIIEVYRRRRDLMLGTMKEVFPKEVKYTYPKGGLFIWVELPEHINAEEVSEKALEKKVAFIVGNPFFPRGGHDNTFRMNFSNMPEDKIVEGVKRLGAVLNELLVNETV